MTRHQKFAIRLSAAVWGFLTFFPPAVVWCFSVNGLSCFDTGFFGFIVGAVLFFQAVFSAQVSERYNSSNFAFMLSCTAMGAFVTLAGPSILPGNHDKLVSPGVAQLNYAGMLVSLALSYGAAQALKRGGQPNARVRLLLFVLSGGLFAYYVFMVLYSSRT